MYYIILSYPKELKLNLVLRELAVFGNYKSCVQSTVVHYIEAEQKVISALYEHIIQEFSEGEISILRMQELKTGSSF